MGEVTHQRLGVRAISIASSAIVVAITCVLLVLASRIPTDFETPVSEGVYATIEERPRPQERPAQRPPAMRVANAAAAPTPTPLPIDRAMLARTLSCFSRRVSERPPNCPPPQDAEASIELPAGGDFAQPEELDINRVYTPAELRTIVTPSCRRDGGGCIPIGPRPPPPSRSAEEVCEDEGIGPCRPPPFREEDVVRQRHTR